VIVVIVVFLVILGVVGSFQTNQQGPSVPQIPQTSQACQSVYLTTRDTNLYSEPRLGGPVVQGLPTGSRLCATGLASPHWREVLVGQTDGWVFSPAISALPIE